MRLIALALAAMAPATQALALSLEDDDAIVSNVVEMAKRTHPANQQASVAAAVAKFRRKQEEARATKCARDMQSLARTLETYRTNNGSYPPATMEASRSAVSRVRGGAQPPSFRVDLREHESATLTTPIAYMPGYLSDEFALKDDSYAYYTTTTQSAARGYILFSPGPNRAYDLDWQRYDPSLADPMEPLRAYCYDPTNGTGSAGDIIYTKRKGSEKAVREWLRNGGSIFQVPSLE